MKKGKNNENILDRNEGASIVMNSIQAKLAIL